MYSLQDIQEFYQTKKGEMAEQAITTSLQKVWTPIHQERLVGFGYTIPWLNRFSSDAERTINIMPPKLGATKWPIGKKNATIVADIQNIPLPDSSIDRVLIVHGFENFSEPHVALQEIWRVLAPAGTLIIVTPNKNGIWAKIKNNPFATKNSVSKSQIKKMLEQTMFSVNAWSSALHFIPSDRFINLAPKCEKNGRKLFGGLGGVIIVEAKKEMLSGITVRNTRAKRLFVKTLTPQSATKIIPENQKSQ